MVGPADALASWCTQNLIVPPSTAALMVDLGYTKPEIASIFGVTVRTIERDLAKNKKNDEQRFCDIP